MCGHGSLKGEIPQKKCFRSSVNGFLHQIYINLKKLWPKIKGWSLFLKKVLFWALKSLKNCFLGGKKLKNWKKILKPKKVLFQKKTPAPDFGQSFLRSTGCLKKTLLKEMCDFLTLKMLPLDLALIKTKNCHLFDPSVRRCLFYIRI